MKQNLDVNFMKNEFDYYLFHTYKVILIFYFKFQTVETS